MIVPDVNLLVYAYVRGIPDHNAARRWWEGTVNGEVAVGLPWSVIIRNLDAVGAGGDLVPDAHIAALTMEYGTLVHSNDTDAMIEAVRSMTSNRVPPAGTAPPRLMSVANCWCHVHRLADQIEKPAIHPNLRNHYAGTRTGKHSGNSHGHSKTAPRHQRHRPGNLSGTDPAYPVYLRQRQGYFRRHGNRRV